MLKLNKNLYSKLTSLIGNGDIRLVNGTTTFEGRLEVYHDGAWGTVCISEIGSTSRGLNQVVCKQLWDGGLPSGFYGLYFARVRSQNAPAGREIFLSDLQCQGSEVNVTSCSHPGWGVTTTCGYGNDDVIGVECIVPEPSEY